MKRTLFIAIITFAASVTMSAKVVLPSLLADNMVLQQNSDITLWGRAEANSNVLITPSWCEAAINVVADQDGEWTAHVDTPAAGGPYSILFDDGEPVTINNIMIGEVWLCSGQSNMVMPMKGYRTQPVEGAMDYIVSAKPTCPIRICTITRKAELEEKTECESHWAEHTPDGVAGASAVAYFFARKIQETLDVPVGVIISAWGSSMIEAWMSKSALEPFSSEVDLSFLESGILPGKPVHSPTLLYNGMLAPLKNYKVKGFLWYQGCNNRNNAELYSRLQPAFVGMLREMWHDETLPFYYVQLASYKFTGKDKSEGALVREAQAKNLSEIAHSGMVVGMDCGDEGCIHPARKKPIGDRLAYLALQKTYGMTGFDAISPMYESHRVENSKVYVKFTDSEMGVGPQGRNLKGFELAGEDKVFHPAQARTTKDCNVIVISSEHVADPVAVRYAFRNHSEVSVYNAFGIPASPFRTDDWQE